MQNKFRYLVLGAAGRQGVAIAYDLAKNCDAETVILADSDSAALDHAHLRLARLLPDATNVFKKQILDVSNTSQTAAAMNGTHVVISSVPYRFNPALTVAAIRAGASFCDLGGNTEIVRTQLAHDEAAKAANVSIVPDCGLAPGLGNILAAHGIAQFDEAHAAHIRCGGLPETPVGPLGYKLLFNFQGLINEYSGYGEFLRDGAPTLIPALTELESVAFDLSRFEAAPPDRATLHLEAAITSGGTSTCAETFRGKIRDYDYKTLRYPGHFAIVKAMMDLAMFDEEVPRENGESLRPKAVNRALLEEKLRFPEVRDMTVLTVTVTGVKDGRQQTRRYDLFDRHDEATGFTAMERTTGFPTAIVAHMKATGEIQPGAHTPERCLPTDAFMKQLPRHDLRIIESQG
ncbi:MAG: saccharopine dehydrogenase family protein [Phycisphaerae bacterium]